MILPSFTKKATHLLQLHSRKLYLRWFYEKQFESTKTLKVPDAFLIVYSTAMWRNGAAMDDV